MVVVMTIKYLQMEHRKFQKCVCYFIFKLLNTQVFLPPSPPLPDFGSFCHKSTWVDTSTHSSIAHTDVSIYTCTEHTRTCKNPGPQKPLRFCSWIILIKSYPYHCDIYRHQHWRQKWWKELEQSANSLRIFDCKGEFCWEGATPRRERPVEKGGPQRFGKQVPAKEPTLQLHWTEGMAPGGSRQFSLSCSLESHGCSHFPACREFTAWGHPKGQVCDVKKDVLEREILSLIPSLAETQSEIIVKFKDGRRFCEPSELVLNTCRPSRPAAEFP